MTQTHSTDAEIAPRIPLIDMARGFALIAMTTFHFSWDLEFFGYAASGLTSAPAFKWYARAIAFSFLMLAGISFALAHGKGLRRSAFLKRLAQIGAAAALISVATWFATPDAFVFFGILHQIALASLIAALFIRLPIPVILVAAGLFLLLPSVFRSSFFETPWLWWTGLGAQLPRANDYVPVFPWTGAMLLGLGVGKYAISRGLGGKIAALAGAQRQPGKALAILGRHSLAYYLIHQPVLFGILYVATQFMPPDRSAGYQQSCVASCLPSAEAAFCERFCGCVRETLEGKGIFDEMIAGKRDVATDPEILDTASQCTAKAAE